MPRRTRRSASAGLPPSRKRGRRTDGQSRWLVPCSGLTCSGLIFEGLHQGYAATAGHRSAGIVPRKAGKWRQALPPSFGHHYAGPCHVMPRGDCGSTRAVLAFSAEKPADAALRIRPPCLDMRCASPTCRSRPPLTFTRTWLRRSRRSHATNATRSTLTPRHAGTGDRWSRERYALDQDAGTGHATRTRRD